MGFSRFSKGFLTFSGGIEMEHLAKMGSETYIFLLSISTERKVLSVRFNVTLQLPKKACLLDVQIYAAC